MLALKPSLNKPLKAKKNDALIFVVESFCDCFFSLFFQRDHFVPDSSIIGLVGATHQPENGTLNPVRNLSSVLIRTVSFIF